MLTSFTLVLHSKAIRSGLAGLSLLFTASLAAVEPRAGRLISTFDGIKCEYSPGQEELARELAQRFTRHSLEVADQTTVKTEAVPLGPTEMRANRTVYLGRIAALLALEKPTSLQEECYDAFLGNYDELIQLFVQLGAVFRSMQRVKHFAIWERAELVRRLESGEKIAGLSYDPVTKSGRVKFGADGKMDDAKLKELTVKREKLRLAYNLNYDKKDGITSVRGGFGPKTNPATSPSAKATTVADDITQCLPVIIPAELSTMAAKELADKLWAGLGDQSLVSLLGLMGKSGESLPVMDAQFAYLILHETTEVGIVDRYFNAPDRRWFCDGMANYFAWRVTRDLHGEAAAASVYNLPKQLAGFADLREQADLRKWPAVENQSDKDQHSRLNSARYAFATRAVALMNERAGEDILPKLFTEIGHTPRDKVSIKTVDKAWKKLTDTKLDTVLADAVKPLTKPAK